MKEYKTYVKEVNRIINDNESNIEEIRNELLEYYSEEKMI